jgi:hypothetical protein
MPQAHKRQNYRVGTSHAAFFPDTACPDVPELRPVKEKVQDNECSMRKPWSDERPGDWDGYTDPGVAGSHESLSAGLYGTERCTRSLDARSGRKQLSVRIEATKQGAPS